MDEFTRLFGLLVIAFILGFLLLFLFLLSLLLRTLFKFLFLLLGVLLAARLLRLRGFCLDTLRRLGGSGLGLSLSFGGSLGLNGLLSR